MRMMGLDQVEKAILVMNPIQRLLGCMADSKEFSVRNVLTSLPVSHHRSSCYYSLWVLMFSLIWGGESNEMKVWVLFLRFKLAWYKNLICHRYKLEFLFSIFILALREGKRKFKVLCLLTSPFGTHMPITSNSKIKIIPYIYIYFFRVFSSGLNNTNFSSWLVGALLYNGRSRPKKLKTYKMKESISSVLHLVFHCNWVLPYWLNLQQLTWPKRTSNGTTCLTIEPSGSPAHHEEITSEVCDICVVLLFQLACSINMYQVLRQSSHQIRQTLKEKYLEELTLIVIAMILKF